MFFIYRKIQRNKRNEKVIKVMLMSEKNSKSNSIVVFMKLLLALNYFFFNKYKCEKQSG